jgi:hypothetical protein
MTDHPKDPSTRELLERIAALETENSTQKGQINFLEKENGKLAALISKHVIRLDNRMLGIEDQLFEVVEKLFPGNARTQAQILDIVKPGWRADKPA